MVQQFNIDSLFRPDGTPMFVSYDKRRPYRPPWISIVTYGPDKKRNFQKTISTHGKDVYTTWAGVGDIWLSAIGLSKENEQGAVAYKKFVKSLEPFLLRYQIDTEYKRTFR